MPNDTLQSGGLAKLVENGESRGRKNGDQNDYFKIKKDFLTQKS
jgi:hypothetical protein